MRKDFLSAVICLVIISQFSLGQYSEGNSTIKEFPFNSGNWRIENPDKTESEIKTLVFKGRSAIKLEGSQKAYLKNEKFENFVLDFHCNGLSGPGFGFRVQDPQNYEYVYLRLGLSGKRDALQYVPVFNGSLPWQLYNYPQYEGRAKFPREKVGTLPLSIKDELVNGKASYRLIGLLEKKGFSFSKDSEVALGDDVNYIYDPLETKALLFEELNNEIVFLDPKTWIHVKVEVVEDRALFYIENMKTPTFVVENLKRETNEGSISLIGDGAGVYFSDVTITELQKLKNPFGKPSTGKLSTNYMTKWELSEMFVKDSLNFAAQIDSLFKNSAKFKTIKSDEDGLIDISRFYGDMTKTVALTCNLESESDKTVKLYFDYADYLVILLNSRVLFDKGMNFAPPVGKGEEGRVFVEDESVELNLKKGENQLVFMLSGDNRQKFNWGFIAKLERIEGIEKN